LISSSFKLIDVGTPKKLVSSNFVPIVTKSPQLRTHVKSDKITNRYGKHPSLTPLF